MIRSLKIFAVRALAAAGLVFVVMRAPSAALPGLSGTKGDLSAELAGNTGDLLKAELSKRYGGARVELTSALRWSGEAPSKVKNVQVISEPARGVALFVAQPGDVQGQVSFGAWTPSLVAIRRIAPDEKLTRDLFVQQDINIATGMAYEYRGIMVPVEQDVVGLESRQTILEGQYLLATAVQRTPDLRRGENVRVRILSGGVNLTTHGTAIEPAYFGGPVRVSTRNKRELSGRLVNGGVVEVKL